MAQHLAERIGQTDDLELMGTVPLNIVPFRYHPAGLSEAELDDLNQRLGVAVLADGRFLVGTSRLGPRTIFRPAFSNWRTRREDVDEFVAVIRELGARLLS
jgi:glutamate/tyrosine decarboxylase-like PLP-dependent enzyme